MNRTSAPRTSRCHERGRSTGTRILTGASAGIAIPSEALDLNHVVRSGLVLLTRRRRGKRTVPSLDVRVGARCRQRRHALGFMAPPLQVPSAPDASGWNGGESRSAGPPPRATVVAMPAARPLPSAAVFRARVPAARYLGAWRSWPSDGTDRFGISWLVSSWWRTSRLSY